MRSTICDDGVKRIMAKVEVPVDSRSITYYALRHPEVMNNENPEAKIKSLNKRQIFLLAKETLRLWGTDDPFETVAENYKNGAVERIGQHVRSLFPEID